jgi:hypothetical protein
VLLDLRLAAESLARARYYVQLGRVDLAAAEVAGVQAYIELANMVLHGEHVVVH